MIENLIAQDGAPQLGAAARRDAAFRLWAIPDSAVARVDRSPDRMKSHRTLEFQSSPAGPTGGWRVQIRIGVEHVRYIYGFDTQFDADEWIEREADEWMKQLGAS